MSEAENELWRVMDHAVFGTNDPEEIKKSFSASFEAWQKERSTLGGYLRSIRKMRDLRTAECAKQVGVSRELWQAWEANRSLPSPQELEKIIAGMHFGVKKRETLYRLRKEAPRVYLQRMTNFQPQLRAARGVSKADRELEWAALPDEVKAMVESWAVSKGFESLEAVFEHLSSLNSEGEQNEWLQEVTGDA